jgi:hypothetical protein
LSLLLLVSLVAWLMIALLSGVTVHSILGSGIYSVAVSLSVVGCRGGAVVGSAHQLHLRLAFSDFY